MRNQKQDFGKTRYDLVPFDALDEVAKVLTQGAEKYEPGNWLKDSKLEDLYRYEAALLRHMSSHMQGEYLDAESGLPHMAHIACNSLFVIGLKKKFTAEIDSKEQTDVIYLKSQGPDYKGEVLSVYGARFFVKFECEKSPCLITREEFSYAI